MIRTIRSNPVIGRIIGPAQTILLVVVTAWLIMTFMARAFEIHQTSMSPTLRPGDRVFVDILSPRVLPYADGDIVIFDDPRPDGQQLIKRVIGTPGQAIEIRMGDVYRNGIKIDETYLPSDTPTIQMKANGVTTWTLGSDQYLMFGDNRISSDDSRVFGSVTASAIIGRVLFRYWPLTAIGGP